MWLRQTSAPLELPHMNDQPTVPSQPTPSPFPPPKKSSGCLKAFLWVAGIVLFLFIIVAILIWQSVSWLKNAPEPKIATYPALKLAPGEEEDVNRIIASIDQAKQRDALCEEYITPTVFNGLMEKILDGERAKGKLDVPLFLRAGLVDSDKLELKITQPMKDEKAPDGAALFVNAEVVFRLEIVDGELRQANIDKLVLRGRDAPFLSRVVVNHLVAGIKAASQQDKNNTKENKLIAIKLLKRDGDRIHIILDGKTMREQDQQQEQNQKNEKKPPQPEKPGTF